ncbi:Glycoside hydrolase family 1 [Sergentomyia squamirostris]
MSSKIYGEILVLVLLSGLLLVIAHTKHTSSKNPCLWKRKSFPKSFPDPCLAFPKDFLFGAGTAAYQVEGGWNEDSRGPSIWDTLIHNNPELIKDRSSGDVGPDSYHLYREDVKRLKQLGVDFYRFSISWPRIMPTGDISSLNPAGVKYYNDLINHLIEEGIKPMVTMFHLDLPQYLQDLGGLANPLIVKYFREYARVLFDNYGDRVKLWATFNEPWAYCYYGHATAEAAPMLKLHGVGEYYCAYHTILAHTEAYHLYKDRYKGHKRGKVGITLSGTGFLQKTRGDELTNRGYDFEVGFFANPFFSCKGGWPKSMQDTVDRNSKKEGRAWSRLPTFTHDQIKRIKGSADFLGINYYTGRILEPANYDWTSGSPGSPPNPSWERDRNLFAKEDPSWPQAKSDWIYSYPGGLKHILEWIRSTYNNPEVIITENGWSDDGELEDEGRVETIKGHLRAILEALREGCRVTAYSHWSLIDNFEWMQGYTNKFGLYRVDMEDPEKKRVEKKSARVYREIIKSRYVM